MQKYPDNLLYYCGSPMVKYDLRRMRLRNAAACFIFARAATGDVRNQLLSACLASTLYSRDSTRSLWKPGSARGGFEEHPACSRYPQAPPLDTALCRGADAECPSALWLDLQLHEHLHLGALDGSWRPFRACRCCWRLIRSPQGLVARSISVPGSNTLIGNLLYSSTFRAVNKSRVPRFTWPWLDRLSHLTRYFKRFRPRPQWAIEYGSGQAKEMYDCLLPKSYSGKTFHEVVRVRHEQRGVLDVISAGAFSFNCRSCTFARTRSCSAWCKMAPCCSTQAET